jgi:hypothetical protein
MPQPRPARRNPVWVTGGPAHPCRAIALASRVSADRPKLVQEAAQEPEPR